MAASASDKVWDVGIQDPTDRGRILNKLSISNGAVATSGAYERGAHIINPITGRPADYWTSVSVTGPDIVSADVLATACFAAGEDAAKLMKSFEDYKLIGIKA